MAPEHRSCTSTENAGPVEAAAQSTKACKARKGDAQRNKGCCGRLRCLFARARRLGFSWQTLKLAQTTPLAADEMGSGRPTPGSRAPRDDVPPPPSPHIDVVVRKSHPEEGSTVEAWRVLAHDEHQKTVAMECTETAANGGARQDVKRESHRAQQPCTCRSSCAIVCPCTLQRRSFRL